MFRNGLESLFNFDVSLFLVRVESDNELVEEFLFDQSTLYSLGVFLVLLVGEVILQMVIEHSVRRVHVTGSSLEQLSPLG